MNITLVNQFYPPDQAPTGAMLHDLAQTLVARGHTVHVITSNQAYNARASFPLREERDGVRISRVRASGFGRGTAIGRLVGYGSFVTMCSVRLLAAKPKPDLILAMTTPPFLGLIVKIAAALRGARHVHWIMDLYPDVMVAHGMLKRNGLMARATGAMTRFSLRGSAGVLAIGPDMADRISAYTTSPVDCIPLWGKSALFAAPDPAAIEMYRTSRGWKVDDIVFMYSGNMGRGHRLSEFLDMASETKARDDVRWVFCGDGSRQPDVKRFLERHADCGVELHPYADVDKLQTHLASADVHLVSLDAAWKGCMVPSKLQGALASGRPVIYIGALDSSAGHWVQEGNAGWVVPEDDRASLADAVDCACDSGQRQSRGAHAATFAREHFDGATNTARIADRLESYTTR